MAMQSNHGDRARPTIQIGYEGVVIGQGSLCLIDPSRAFVEVCDFPLGANSFLELILYAEDNRQVNVPVRVISNTGEGLEVEIEGIDPLILRVLRRLSDPRAETPIGEM